MSLLQLVNAARTINALRNKPEEFKAQSFFGQFDYWIYLPIYDERLCEQCEAHARTLYFRGTELRRMFPYLNYYDENTLKANVHPHCRCELLRVTTPEQYFKAKEKLGA
jgi:hypothetical protein